MYFPVPSFIIIAQHIHQSNFDKHLLSIFTNIFSYSTKYKYVTCKEIINHITLFILHKINLIKPFISNRSFCSNINVYFSPERKGVATPFIQERRYFLETTLRSTTTNNVLAIDARGQDPDPDSRGPQIYRVHLRLPFHGSFCTTSSYHRFAISLSPRADARCRGERHAAFWPARSCSKTSLTCAVRSVLFFDTLPIGFARAPPFPHRLRNSSKLRPQRHFVVAPPLPAASRFLGNPYLPIEASIETMLENSRPLFVRPIDPRVVVGQPMLWSIPPRPLGWGENYDYIRRGDLTRYSSLLEGF